VKEAEAEYGSDLLLEMAHCSLDPGATEGRVTLSENGWIDEQITLKY
jgi:hypothetical protein